MGGSNIDEIILNWLIKRFDETYGEELIPASLSDEMKTQTRSGLLSLCEQAKEQLFDMDEYEIEPQIYMDEGYSVTITRDILNDLIDEELDKTMKIVERALNKAGLSKRDISRVVLVGGSTRLLLVQKKLADYFGKEKTTQSVNPDECVAQGACMALVNNVLPKEKTVMNVWLRELVWLLLTMFFQKKRQRSVWALHWSIMKWSVLFLQITIFHVANRSF